VVLLDLFSGMGELYCGPTVRSRPKVWTPEIKDGSSAALERLICRRPRESGKRDNCGRDSVSKWIIGVAGVSWFCNDWN